MWGTEASDLCSAPLRCNFPKPRKIHGVLEVCLSALGDPAGHWLPPHQWVLSSSYIQLWARPSCSQRPPSASVPPIWPTPHSQPPAPRKKGAAGTLSHLWELRCCLIFRFPLSLFFVQKLLITESMFLLVIGLVRFSTSSVNLGSLCILRNLSVSSRLSNFRAQRRIPVLSFVKPWLLRARVWESIHVWRGKYKYIKINLCL